VSIDRAVPDYELADRVEVSAPGQLRALADPLRSTILDLVLERAATVNELAAAVGRPKSTVAHHVGVLVDAGMLQVVRTRRVRAIEERFYGRTARIFAIEPTTGVLDPALNPLGIVAAETADAARTDELRAIVRYVRIPRDRVSVFWQRLLELSQELTREPRGGTTVYGFAVAFYPVDRPTLPDTDYLADAKPEAAPQ
jgi:DNA-binding transcriptional ArsR family regulator